MKQRFDNVDLKEVAGNPSSRRYLVITYKNGLSINTLFYENKKQAERKYKKLLKEGKNERENIESAK